MTMTPRERFFARAAGKPVDKVPFFPDLTKWYEYHRLGKSPEIGIKPGGYLSPDSDLHNEAGKLLPEDWRDKDLFAIAKTLDVGIPVHGYDCFYKKTHPNCNITKTQEGDKTTITLQTPKGELTEVMQRCADGSLTRVKHMVEDVEEDIEAFQAFVDDWRFEEDFANAQSLLDNIGEQGYLNQIVGRSPFGELMINAMGLENLVYGIMDDEEIIKDTMSLLTERLTPVWDLAAQAPGDVVFISDNIDEQLYSPPMFEEYMLPSYQTICKKAHDAGKIVLAHMDGRLTNLLGQGIIAETGLDVLDGCTPAPVNDYEPALLTEKMGANQVAYCGVPCTLFVDSTTPEQTAEFTRKILNEMGERVILNIGDIMPNTGDINRLISMNEVIQNG